MGRKPVLVPFLPMVLQASSSMSRWYASDFFVDGAGRNHVRVLAHLAQYEEANEAIITRTIFCYLLVCTPWSSFMWLLRLCRVFYSCIVYVYPSRSPLGMAASTLGQLHGIFFHGVPQLSLYRLAGESLVLQT